ncbi:GntR family transcriptional regulator [Niveispirillum fermenti]|uniref:GntR family transcriptional regulator n=1 Tax=Niveispirillum fermenti TaxID=1233113 RepID=UPI003A86D944
MQSKAGQPPHVVGGDRNKLWPPVDASLPTPLYHQVFLTLQEKIRRGDFGADGQLPSDQEIADRLEVSRITVKRALQELAARKMVVRGRGRGTVVAPNSGLPIVRGSFDGLTDSVLESGFGTKIDLLETTSVPASPSVAHRMEVSVGTPMHRSKWRRRIEGQPFSFFTSFVCESVAERFGVNQEETLPFALVLQSQGYDRLMSGQWISATAAETEVAAVLAVDVGYPVLRVERVMHDEQGDPIQYLIGFYRSDQFNWYIRSEGPFVGTVVKKMTEKD